MAFVKLTSGTFRPDPKPEPKEKKKKKKISYYSEKRKIQNAEYVILAAEFIIGKICPITGRPAEQVHHRKGRIGKLLTDVRFFLAVTDEGHKEIEAKPEWAYEMGYSLLRTKTT